MFLRGLLRGHFVQRRDRIPFLRQLWGESLEDRRLLTTLPGDFVLPAIADIVSNEAIIARLTADGTWEDSVGGYDFASHGVDSIDMPDFSSVAKFERDDADYLEGDLALPSTFSLSFWAYMDSEPDAVDVRSIAYDFTGSSRGFCFYYIREAGVDEFVLIVNSSGKRGDDATVRFPFSLPVNQWVHVALTHDASRGGETTLIVDGELVGTGSTGKSAIFNSTNPFRFGADNHGTNPWDGFFKDFIVFNQTLSPEKAAELYRSYWSTASVDEETLSNSESSTADATESAVNGDTTDSFADQVVELVPTTVKLQAQELIEDLGKSPASLSTTPVDTARGTTTLVFGISSPYYHDKLSLSFQLTGETVLDVGFGMHPYDTASIVDRRTNAYVTRPVDFNGGTERIELIIDEHTATLKFNDEDPLELTLSEPPSFDAIIARGEKGVNLEGISLSQEQQLAIPADTNEVSSAPATDAAIEQLMAEAEVDTAVQYRPDGATLRETLRRYQFKSQNVLKTNIAWRTNDPRNIIGAEFNAHRGEYISAFDGSVGVRVYPALPADQVAAAMTDSSVSLPDPLLAHPFTDLNGEVVDFGSRPELARPDFSVLLEVEPHRSGLMQTVFSMEHQVAAAWEVGGFAGVSFILNEGNELLVRIALETTWGGKEWKTLNTGILVPVGVRKEIGVTVENGLVTLHKAGREQDWPIHDPYANEIRIGSPLNISGLWELERDGIPFGTMISGPWQFNFRKDLDPQLQDYRNTLSPTYTSWADPVAAIMPEIEFHLKRRDLFDSLMRGDTPDPALVRDVLGIQAAHELASDFVILPEQLLHVVEQSAEILSCRAGCASRPELDRAARDLAEAMEVLIGLGMESEAIEARSRGFGIIGPDVVDVLGEIPEKTQAISDVYILSVHVAFAAEPQNSEEAVTPTQCLNIDCPQTLEELEEQSESWKPYYGYPILFHCGFEGYVENCTPQESLQSECFYDSHGQLSIGWCQGSPNRHDAESDGLRHLFNDPGGVHSDGELTKEARLGLFRSVLQWIKEQYLRP